MKRDESLRRTALRLTLDEIIAQIRRTQSNEAQIRTIAEMAVSENGL